MTNPDPEPSLREIGQTLAAEVRALSKEVEKLDRSIRRGRHVIIAIVFSLVFDIVISAFLFNVAHRNTENIRAQRAIIHAQCVSSNEVRSETLAWVENLETLFPPSPSLDKIIVSARETFKPEACP